jgi:hypothetical protein
VRVDNGCRQYCEVNNEIVGFKCIEDLFENYYGDDDEKRSARRQTLCTDNRDDTPNDEGKYLSSFELCRTNELIKVLPPELRTHTQASSWL